MTDHQSKEDAFQEDKTLEILLGKVGEELGEKPENLWASQKFQLVFRATNPEHLKILGINGDSQKDAEEAIKAGRLMSLLPYNTIMGDKHLIRKYLPSKPEKFSGDWRHSIDPYGIFRETDRVESIDSKGKKDRPYIKDGRWVVNTSRQYKTVEELLPRLLEDRCGFGKEFRTAKVEVLRNNGILGVKDKGFIGYLDTFL